MSKKYTINLYDVESLKTFESILIQMSKSLESKEFMEFLGNKCMIELNRICNERLNNFQESDMANTEIEKYRTNHKMTISSKKVVISNNTMADLSHLSEKTAANYPDGFSIAKAIEFGTGILGTPDDEWETMANKHRDYEKGWFYEKDGQLYWSKGFEGKFIYYELTQVVERNIKDWIDEYLNSKSENATLEE